MKTTLHLKAQNGGPFNCRPAMTVELEDEKILTNDVSFPWETRGGKQSLYVIGHEFGPIAAVWAEHTQEALDILCDEGLSDCFMEENQEQNNEDGALAHLGNAGELHDLTNVWIGEVDFQPERDWKLLMRFAEARGGNYETLDAV